MAANIGTAISGWSTTASSNQPDSTDLASTLREDLQAIQAAVRYLRTSGTIASAGTTDLSTKSEEILSVSGTTTITALGTVSAGMIKVLVFEGALTLTHNGTSLILPAAANITTAAGDVATMLSLGSGNWRCLDYQRASGYGVKERFTLIETQTAASAASVTFTTLSQTVYRKYVLICEDMTLSADAAIQLKFGSGGIDGTAAYGYVSTQTISTSVTGSTTSGATFVQIGTTIESSGTVTTMGADIYPVGTTNGVRVIANNFFVNTSGGTPVSENVAGYYTGGAVTHCQVNPSAGTFSGTFHLYGVL